MMMDDSAPSQKKRKLVDWSQTRNARGISALAHTRLSYTDKLCKSLPNSLVGRGYLVALLLYACMILCIHILGRFALSGIIMLHTRIFGRFTVGARGIHVDTHTDTHTDRQTVPLFYRSCTLFADSTRRSMLLMSQSDTAYLRSHFARFCSRAFCALHSRKFLKKKVYLNRLKML